MHTFLSLDMNLIPQSTKDNVPTFWRGRFSNDKSRMLIDGYNSKRQLVHPQQVLSAWLQWEDNPEEAQKNIIDNAQEFTRDQFISMTEDKNSIWYTEEVGI